VPLVSSPRNLFEIPAYEGNAPGLNSSASSTAGSRRRVLNGEAPKSAFDTYGGAQLYMYGKKLISQNGSSGDPTDRHGRG